LTRKTTFGEGRATKKKEKLIRGWQANLLRHKQDVKDLNRAGIEGTPQQGQ